jgi:adenylate kinase family enzyme
MKRVLVIGSSGAGKSTFAINLGKIINLPVIHLDGEFWQPGWIEMLREDWRENARGLVRRDRWIMDGTYDNSLDIRLPFADTVIFLDYPRRICLWRAVRRITSNHGRVRSDMAEGCPEKVDWSFIKWIWNYRRDRYPVIYDSLKKYFSHGNLIVFKNPSEAAKYLRTIR